MFPFSKTIELINMTNIILVYNKTETFHLKCAEYHYFKFIYDK